VLKEGRDRGVLEYLWAGKDKHSVTNTFISALTPGKLFSFTTRSAGDTESGRKQKNEATGSESVLRPASRSSNVLSSGVHATINRASVLQTNKIWRIYSAGQAEE